MLVGPSESGRARTRRGALSSTPRAVLAALCIAGCGGGADDTAYPPVHAGNDDASVPDVGTDLPSGETSGDAIAGDVASDSTCSPKTCAQLGAACGSAPDECGGTTECGSCPAGQVCGGAGANKCGSSQCTPKTCAQLGASCGLASDGCGSTVSCGSCTAPQTCGGGGNPQQCGCTPTSCAALGAQCDTLPDGCGSTLSCGTCSFGSCVSNQCSCTPSCGGKTCGDADGCGGACATGAGCRSVSLDFGGAWGYVNGGTLSPNPATAAASCPANFGAMQVAGAANVDWGIYFCLRKHLPATESIYDFGGMWGYVEAAVENNPLTGAGSCPAGYTDQSLANTANVDWPLHLCYKPHSAGTSPENPLGGLWGYINGGTLAPNPATNAASCPADYVSKQIWGTTGTDWPVFFCR